MHRPTWSSRPSKGVAALAALSMVGTAGLVATAVTLSGPRESSAAPSPSAPAASAPRSVAGTLNAAYPVPPGAVFVSVKGNDRNKGTKTEPVRTLAKGMALARAGGTVVLRGGVYREGSGASVYKKLTLQPYPHEEVWLDGTDVVRSGWTSAGRGVWSRAWSTPSFCDGKYYSRHYLRQGSDNRGPCTHKDMAKDPANPAAGDPQMVFLNGRHAREVSSRGAVTAGTFFYDFSARRMYLGADPRSTTVELAARPVALVLQGGNGFTIRGIGFRRYATNEYNGNKTHGAVLAGQPNVVIERAVFSENAGAGLSYSDARGGIVRSSFFDRNGFNGLDVNGHWTKSPKIVDDFLLENSRFDGNNRELFGKGCNASCASAGSKMAHMNGVTVRGNIFENTKGNGKGYWCDLACNRGVIVNNIVRNNGDVGIFWEVSDTGIVASNLIHGNADYGIKMGSANTKIYNNTIAYNKGGILLFDDNRSPGVGGWRDVGPDTRNVSVVNNIVAANGGAAVKAWRTSGSGRNTGPSTFVATMNANSYHRPAGRTPLVEWRDGRTTVYPTLAAFRAARGKEAQGWESTAAADPFFVDARSGNFALRAGSAASGNGLALPADVAKAVGVAAGRRVDRGALRIAGAAGTGEAKGNAPSTPAPGAGPTVRSTPAAPGTVSGRVQLAATASGTDVVRAELYLGSDLSHTFSGPGPYRFGWDTTRVSNGTRVRVTWKVIDRAGRVGVTVGHLTVANRR